MDIIDSHTHLFAVYNAIGLNKRPAHPLHGKNKSLDVYIESHKKFINKGIVVIEAETLTGPKSIANPPTKDSYNNIALLEFDNWLRLIHAKQLPAEGTTKLGYEYIKGVVPWIPLIDGDEAIDTMLNNYKDHCIEKEDFQRIKSTRFLLQFYDEFWFEKNWEKVYKGINHLHEQWKLPFDVCMDMKMGNFQFEYLSKILENLKSDEGKIKLVFNHLSKPNYHLQLSLKSPDDIVNDITFQNWVKNIENFAKDTEKYESFVKLSGSFDQLPVEISKKGVKESAKFIYPWFEKIFENFGEDRIIFGTDWPVCGILFDGNTPKKWLLVVLELFELMNFDDEIKQKFFFKNVQKIYSLC